MILNHKGKNIFVCDINPPHAKETLLMLHGWPLSGKMFEYQYKTLPKYGIRCVTPDFTGYGNSDKPWDGYTYNELAALVHNIITSMNLSNVTLLGFSMGGAVAAKYAAKYGAGRVKKLILLGAACPVFIKTPAHPFGMEKSAVNALISQVGADKPLAFSEFSKLVFENTPSAPFDSWFASVANAAAPHSAQRGLEQLRDSDLTSDLKTINIETAIMHGTADRVCPFGFAGEMNSLIKHSHAIKFEGAGHGIFYEQKDKLNREIADFIIPGVIPRENAPAAENAPVYIPYNDGGARVFSAASFLQKGSKEEYGIAPYYLRLPAHYPFSNPPLSYPNNAFEPNIDEKTMRIHRENHLGAYVEKLNAALKNNPELQSKTLEELIYSSGDLNEPLKTIIEHNAGGVFNHYFYFGALSPAPAPAPNGKLKELIDRDFNGLDNFKAEFSAAAAGVFGSGYAWLVLNSDYKLIITTTKNQSVTVSDGLYPLLNIDVWEHAYYLKYQYARPDYIKNSFNIINWDVVSARLADLKEFN